MIRTDIPRRDFLRSASAGALAAIAPAALFGCGRGDGKWKRLQIGYLSIAAELPLFVAVEQGFFHSEKLEFDLIPMTSSNDMATAATAGRLDVLGGAATNVVFDAGVVSGKRHRLIAENPYSNRPGFVTDYMLVKDPARRPRLDSLRGTRIASNAGSVNRLLVSLILAKHGVPERDYEYVELLPKDWEPALRSGAIDALSGLEPLATQIMADGVGTSIFPGFYADLMPDLPLAGHWLSADFVANAPREQQQAIIRAYDRSIDFIRANETAAKRYYVKYANARPDIVDRTNVNPWKKRSEIDVSTLSDYVDILIQHGAIHKGINVSNFIYE